MPRGTATDHSPYYMPHFTFKNKLPIFEILAIHSLTRSLKFMWFRDPAKGTFHTQKPQLIN